MATNYIDSKAIEEKAINEVKRFFEDSNIVSTFIAENDKEPFWDGHLYLYPNGVKTKENFQGRIAVQIKGKDLKDFKMGNFSYPIEITALKAYLHEGVVYMIVQEVNQKRKIFYRNLAPILIRNMIHDHEKRKTINVKMFPLEEDLNKVEANLLQFKIDCRMQISYVDSEPLNIDTLIGGGLKSFSFTLFSTEKSHIFSDMLTNPVYIYANMPENTNVQIPMGEGPVYLSIGKEVKEPVRVKEREFFSSYTNEVGNGTITIKVGDCLELIIVKDFSKSLYNATINFKIETTFLKEIIKETEFILAMTDVGEVTIGKVTMPISLEKKPLISELRKKIKIWKEMDNTLNTIGTNEDLDLSCLTPKDEQILNVLVEMIGHNQEKNLKDIETSILNVKVANLKLLLFAYKTKSGSYILKSLFDKSLNLKASHKYPNGEFRESLFSRFNRQMILDCYNFPYGEIIPSYEAIMDINPHVFERMNLLLLELLSVYDMLVDESPRKGLALQTAMNMSNWLLDNDTDEKMQDLHLVNKSQILKREGELKGTDKKALKRIQINNTANAFFQCGIALLLDDSDLFEIYWDKLSNEEQAQFKKFPIWIFKQ